MGLSVREMMVLNHAATLGRATRAWHDWRRDVLGYTETGYYAALGRLLDREDALEYAPTVVRRQRRLRDARRAARTG